MGHHPSHRIVFSFTTRRHRKRNGRKYSVATRATLVISSADMQGDHASRFEDKWTNISWRIDNRYNVYGTFECHAIAKKRNLLCATGCSTSAHAHSPKMKKEDGSYVYDSTERKFVASRQLTLTALRDIERRTIDRLIRSACNNCYSATASLQCGKCHVSRYCNAACQKAHWAKQQRR